MTPRQLARKYIAPAVARDPSLVFKLAAQCDVSPNTIRRYLQTSEPMQPASIRRIERVVTDRAKLLRAATELRSTLTEEDWETMRGARVGNLR